MSILFNGPEQGFSYNSIILAANGPSLPRQLTFTPTADSTQSSILTIYYSGPNVILDDISICQVGYMSIYCPRNNVIE